MVEVETKNSPQIYINQQWDQAIDLTVRRVVYGALAGGAAAVLLARSPSARAAAVAFGVGTGVGTAYSDSQTMFKKV